MAKHLQQMDLFGSEPSEAVHIVAPKTSKACTNLQKANLPKQTLIVVTENCISCCPTFKCTSQQTKKRS